MRNFLNAIKVLPHAEERPAGASRSTHGLVAAHLCCVNQFPDSLFRGGDGKRGVPLTMPQTLLLRADEVIE